MRPLLFTMCSLAVAAGLLAGCGQSKSPSRNAGGGTPPPIQATATPATPSPTPSPSPMKQLTIHVYYGDETGNKLVQKDVPITFGTDSEKYLAALNALKKTTDPKLAPLAAGLTFKKAVVTGSGVSIDLSLDPKGQLGSDGEALLLDALKKTMFQFSELQSFDLTVDGQKVDSLMGHMDLPHPIKR